MATPWNPNDPEVVGPEYLPELNRGWTVGATGGAMAALTQRFRSTATETVEYAAVFLSAISGQGSTLLEIVEDGDELPTGITEVMVAPNAAANVVNFKNQAGSTTAANLVASIDETGDPTDLTDWIGPVTPNRPQQIDLEFATGPLTLTGKRILGVSVAVRAMPATDADRTDTYRVSLIAGGVEYGEVDRQINADGGSWFHWGEIDPTGQSYGVVNMPWHPTTLDPGFDNGTIRVRLAVGGGDGIKMSRVRLAIIYADENRVAVGQIAAVAGEVMDPPGMAGAAADEDTGLFGQTTSYVDLYDPATAAAGFAKVNATTYRACWRRAWMGGRLNNLSITTAVLARHDDTLPDPDTYLDDPLVLLPAVTKVPATNPQAVAAVYPGRARAPLGGATEPAGVWCLRLRDSGTGGDVADGQPYTQVWPVPVATTAPIRGYVRTVAGGDYSVVRVVAGYTQQPTEPLDVEVQNAAGTVVLGSGQLTVAQLQASARYQRPGVLCEVLVDLEATIAAATQVRIVFSSDTDAEHPWIVGVLTTRAAVGATPTTSQGAATYRGETDYAFNLPGVSADPWDDLDAQLNLALDGPTDLDVVADLVDFPQAEPGGLDGVPYAYLTWDPGSAGADFATYQLQRRDTIDTEWADIAYLTDEDLEAFSDVEARLVVASEWRIRARGPLGQVSLWSDIESVELPATGCGYTFTTNWLPADSIGYADTYQGAAVRAYAFPDSAGVTVRELAGRDEFVVFRETERRSVRFSREVVVRAFNGPSGIVGPAAFDLLRELVRQPVPYIAVRDEQGNRWWAAVVVSAGSVQQPGEHHRASIEVIPVATSPTPPTITA